MLTDILFALKKSDVYVSGEQLSRQLNISRAAIWKYIHQLRRMGYDIVAVPHIGYKLLSSPDKLFPEEISFNLGTKYIGKRIIYYETITSTMDEAFRIAIGGAEEGCVICADSQTKGRGRMGRRWTSPKDTGIYVSIILRPSVSLSAISWLTLLTAVAVSDSVKEVCNFYPMIKWPNDVLINDRKLAGILTELNAEADRVRFVIIGVGININTPLSFLPKNSTSLRHETGRRISRVEFLQVFLRRLEFWYDILKKGEVYSIADAWKQQSSTLGRRIRIVNGGDVVEGIAVDLDEYGGLLLRSDSGVFVKKMSGDVVYV